MSWEMLDKEGSDIKTTADFTYTFTYPPYDYTKYHLDSKI